MSGSIPFNRIKTIFFDYDGTLHNSIRIYAPAFRKAYAYLVKEGFAAPRDWSEQEISHWIGFNPREMWKTFMPGLADSISNKCSQMIGEEMKALTDKGKAELYEGALDTLQYLKDKGYRLVFISNCKIAYRDNHSSLFRLGDYFEELACSEEYDFMPKYEILRTIIGKYPKEMVIIGDRFQDIKAGQENQIHTIGCDYDHSSPDELQAADLIIHSISELKRYL